VRGEEPVKLGDGRAERRHVRRALGIRRAVLEDPHQGALGRAQIGEHELQEAVGADLATLQISP
jgi:hypothetical protein